MSKISVLDEGYVELVEGWGSDESIIEAARMSTGKGFNGWGTEEKPGDEKLLAYLYNNKHATPFEMGGVVIEVKAPIFVFREWHRHRTQSYNEMSARYIPLPDENYIPSLDRLMAGANTATTNKQAQGNGKQLSTHAAGEWIAQLKDLYQRAQLVYEMGIEMGVPKELARLPVPVARYSRMRACANLRNWLAFLTLRQAPAAQWEIREYANAVGEIIAGRFPRTWELFTKEKQVVSSK
jgi:thymidylate synthase (FAD)